ncbi:MAG TPA: cupin domain-containing protein [Bryobacteraceae bacterium]|nr:cupin domain-containing protein [Bryobacteraceae bacterium]
MKIQILLLLAAAVAGAQNIRVVRFSESDPFRMGEVTSRRIIHPGLGAKKTTLNLSISQPGAEFAQHVHDYSDDTILVLDGEVNLRQGESLHKFKTGECAFVPTGQIHGTITAGQGDTVMISFQNPPDLILYTGARDSKRPGAAPPKGVITPGAVKYVNFKEKQGAFTNSTLGSNRATGSHYLLKKGKSFRTEVKAGGEQLLFVWRGALRVKDKDKIYTAGERDTVFISGEAKLEVIGDAAGETEIIQVQAP